MSSDRKPGIQDKLQFLVKKGTSQLPPPKPASASSHSIDSVVEGMFLPTRRGDVFIVEQTFKA
ncbi:MAG: hypothetical protein ACXW4E_05930, partial [Anaerolineales bacterium]